MDLSNRPRHTHRALARQQQLLDPEQTLSRAEVVDILRDQRREGAPVEDIEPRLPSQDGGELLALLAKEIAEDADIDYEFDHDTSPSISNSRCAKNPHELIKSLQRMVASANLQRRYMRNSSGAAGTARESGTQLTPRHLFSEVKVKAKPAPRVNRLSDGRRTEFYDTGAEVSKDALGRVVSVRSGLGESVAFEYDSQGSLRSFVRTDRSGRDHSTGELDRHGVIVRSSDGRLRAAGETMTVDPLGCLHVHNHDGQFISLDLVRGLHMERKRLTRGDGSHSTVTAVFAHDGFRLATRFNESPADEYRSLRLGAREFIDRFRFYGRDGSMVEFESEEELRALRPWRVLSPGSLPVESSWRSKWQAGTAWEAVQEYLAIIS